MDYLSDELPDGVRLEFERHLERCPTCRHYLSAYKAAVSLGQRAFEDEDQAAEESGAPHQLIEAILASRQRTDG